MKLKSRTKVALGYILGSLALTIVLSLLLGLIHLITDKEFIEVLPRIISLVYLWIGAAPAAAGVLLLVTSVPEDLAFGFGCGLYYGTGIAASWIRDWLNVSESSACVIAFIIVALICYIIWLKEFKQEYA